MHWAADSGPKWRVYPPKAAGTHPKCRLQAWDRAAQHDAAAGVHSIVPPRRVGGNLDMGDTHAAQGDGEVCGTAIDKRDAGGTGVRPSDHGDRPGLDGSGAGTRM
jgi:hypothetical protein